MFIFRFDKALRVEHNLKIPIEVKSSKPVTLPFGDVHWLLAARQHDKFIILMKPARKSRSVQVF